MDIKEIIIKKSIKKKKKKKADVGVPFFHI